MGRVSCKKALKVAVFLPLLASGWSPAVAEAGGSAKVEAQDAVLSSLLLAPAGRDEAGVTRLTIGRDQDIVGAPIDFSMMSKPTGNGGVSQKLRNLPATAALPTRLPLIGASLTSRYGMRWHPVRGGYRAHSGIDLAAPAGSPIYAPAAGVVSAAGWDGGYGISVMIEHGGGLQTRYGHMSRLAVAVGQTVSAGSVIGFVGTTGLSTGPHLHYEIRSRGRAIDPMMVIR